MALDVAQRLLRIGKASAPAITRSNAARSKELQRSGLELVVAASHAANNCLIDALLLALLMNNVWATL